MQVRERRKALVDVSVVANIPKLKTQHAVNQKTIKRNINKNWRKPGNNGRGKARDAMYSMSKGAKKLPRQPNEFRLGERVRIPRLMIMSICVEIIEKKFRRLLTVVD